MCSKLRSTFSLLGLGIVGLLNASTHWQQMLVGVFMGFASSQIAFLGHDAGHRQIMRTARGNDLIGYLVANLLSGVSFTWWMDDHNRHHTATPTIWNLIPISTIRFWLSTAANWPASADFSVGLSSTRNTSFSPILSLSGINLKAGSVKFMIENKFPTRTMEAVMIAIHYVLYFGSLAYLLGWWRYRLSCCISFRGAFFWAACSRPITRECPLMEGEARRDYLRVQVLTSRNVRAHPVTDFLYGGLNYQIEHHLFPSIPRNRMRELQKTVKSFCEEHAISYHETSTLQSYQEILDHLEEVSAPLHEAKAAKRVEFGEVESAVQVLAVRFLFS